MEANEVYSLLKAQRVKLKLTQANLANAINVSQSKISKVESNIGEYTLSELFSLCKILKIRIIFKVIKT